MKRLFIFFLILYFSFINARNITVAEGVREDFSDAQLNFVDEHIGIKLIPTEKEILHYKYKKKSTKSREIQLQVDC
jgi:hypothetical protein